MATRGNIIEKRVDSCGWINAKQRVLKSLKEINSVLMPAK
jgi:hypothetical protein